MELPEELMKEGFFTLQTTREYFLKAKIAYDKRRSKEKADFENSINVQKALQLLGQAYDEVSAIWENDINV